MDKFLQIQTKLHKFTQKYYINELIKGVLLFFSLGLVYFILTLFVESFLWLSPVYRTILFFLFIIVEIGLFIKYILTPLMKLSGLKRGINDFEASKIIGNHFPEISDKLLNMLQLKESNQDSELILASIEQKSSDLKLIPFKKAVNFSSNKKYLKFILIPIVIFAIIFISGKVTVFNDSLSRVVNYNTQFERPAPFNFIVLNKNLNVIEGNSVLIEIETSGILAPETAQISFENQKYFLKNIIPGKFEYSFNNMRNDVEFYISANGFASKKYKIHVLKTPVITNLLMKIDYPNYTGRKSEIIKNSGNAIVSQGSKISLEIEAKKTTKVTFNSKSKSEFFENNLNSKFSFNKQLFSNTSYNISTSNDELENYEVLNFSIQVIPDEFPKIVVKEASDSLNIKYPKYFGVISDDYGITKLQVVFYKKNMSSERDVFEMSIQKGVFAKFNYNFPEGLNLEKGENYEYFFQVFDNDAVNGTKSSVSQTFTHYQFTDKELTEELLKNQNETLNSVKKTLEKSKLSNSDLQKFKKDIQQKSELNWNDSKKLNEFLNRQKMYQEMFEKQTEKIDRNLKQQPNSDLLKSKKEELQNRINETKELAKRNNILDELEKLTKKMSKENLMNKIDELTKKSRNNQKSLERILELTKRFYVEQKTNQLSENLKKLSEKQLDLSKEESDGKSVEKQEKIIEEFEDFKKDFKELEKENRDLQRPMNLPKIENPTSEIDEDLEKASEELKKEQNQNAKQNQKSAGKKMKKMADSMESSMMSGESEMIEENIDDLRKIIENLIEFSFQQEDLLKIVSDSEKDEQRFSNILKQQNNLKDFFEHIDDSLYMLSLRLVKMGEKIQKDVSDVHYNIDKSLENLLENDYFKGASNQHFVITATNNLANELSKLLESLQNATPSLGQGKGKDKGFSLPDIIKKQGEINKQLEEGVKKGENGKKGKGGENGEEQMSSEIFEIYKQQESLKQLLKEMMNSLNLNEKQGAGKAIKNMEDLEKEMLEKGFSKQIVEKIQKLNYELLKLEEAQLKQGIDKKRKSKTNLKSYENREIDSIDSNEEFYDFNEILKRQSLPLRQIYMQKVQEYFKNRSVKNDSI